MCVHVLFWVEGQVNFAEICRDMQWLVTSQVAAVKDI